MRARPTGQKRSECCGESSEFRRLRHDVEKAAGDRERAIQCLPRIRREGNRRAARRGPGGDVGAPRSARLRVPRDQLACAAGRRALWPGCFSAGRDARAGEVAPERRD